MTDTVPDREIATIRNSDTQRIVVSLRTVCGHRVVDIRAHAETGRGRGRQIGMMNLDTAGKLADALNAAVAAEMYQGRPS